LRLPIELHVAMKYLLAKRKQTFISIISFISIGGVAVGVMALIIVLAVMSGFERELKTRILGATAHIEVVSLYGSIENPFEVAKAVSKTRGVVAASPYIISQMMISSGAGLAGGVFRGVDIESVGGAAKLAGDLRSGRIEDLRRPAHGGLPGVILGKELAANLAVRTGDIVEIMTPGGSITPLGAFPKTARFNVAGISESGMYEFDATFAYMSFEEAGLLLGIPGRATGIEVKVKDIYAASAIAAELRSTLGDSFWARDWMQKNRNLFSALKLEKIVMFIILVLIVMVAAFNIISTLIMVVMEKTKDIAILMTMGATRRTIRRIFALEGLIIGIAGTALGALLGAISCFVLKKYKFINLPSDVYYITTLPVNLELGTLLFIVASSITICFLATLYPASQASRVDPAEAIRYE